MLVNLVNHAGRYAEGKCISVNPKKPELIAIGANDAYIRMYDRRMIKLSQVIIKLKLNIQKTYIITGRITRWILWILFITFYTKKKMVCNVRCLFRLHIVTGQEEMYVYG